MKFVMNIFR